MSLRARLLVAVLGLAAVGFLIAGSVTYALLNSFLTSRLDQQLAQAADPAGHILTDALNGRTPGPGDRGGGGPGGRPGPLPPGTYAALVNDSGAVIQQQGFGFTSEQQSAHPTLPNPVPLPSGRGAPVFLTLPGANGAGSYRAVVARADDAVNGDVLVATPLTDVQSTLQRLVLLELGVGLSVLVLLGALGTVAVRQGLRPLDDIAATADEIAAGDLQRRVEPANTKSEVGRLGLALNAMLARIEEAFAARQASEQRLRQFIADASHELRTPVASIRGYAELFRRGAAERPEDLQMAMRRIEDEAGRMGHLVEELLLLARLDEGRPLERQPVDLSQLALDAAADARAIDPARPIAATVSDDAIVAGDEPRLRQVVANLVRNALVHTPAGTPVEVSTAVEGQDAVLSVADHGPGIPPEVGEAVFQRFYRADPARGRASGSTGLGLSIVSAIVAAHNGQVSLHGTPGGGATFTVRLPLYAVPAEEAA